ncbi:TonB-dependent siderophore receptor [bacterium]|nr:TonB-dependent siderophore receptor [bacterium]
MIQRKWTGVLLSLGACLLGNAGLVCAQEPDAATLPEVNVQATPLPLTPPDAVFPPAGFDPTPLLPSTILESTIFGSPKADGYRASSSTAATFVDVPDIELPASVSTVTRDVIIDQQALRIDDILRDVSGATKLSDQLRPDSFLIRGFQVESRDYRKNGMLDPTYTPRDFANVERVEILKGPGSVLYGAGQPSGTVNLVTKKPFAEDYNAFTAQFGSFDFQRYTIDTNGRVNDDGDVLFRVNMAYENRDSFRDYGYNERVFVAPVISWIIDDDTSLTWEGEYLQDRRRFDTGVVALNGQVGSLPIERYLGEPENDFQLFQDWRQSIFLDHRFNDIWTARVMATNIFYYAPSSGTFPLSQDAGTTTINRSRQDITQFFEQYHGLTFNLAAEFLTGAMEHKLVIGTEQGWFISNNFLSESTIPGLQNLPIDAVNPDYTDPNVFFTPAKFESVFRENRHGEYVQDVIKINEQWSTLVGLRYDSVDTTFQRELKTFGIPTLPDTETDQTFTRWTPRVGITYQPIPEEWSIFGSYARSFDAPSGGPRITDDPLKPEIGEAWEVGTKLQLLPRLAGQATWFWIQKDNVTIDTTTSTPPFFVTSQVGQQTSQGMELSLIGNLTDRWTTTSNYTITDAVLRDPTNPDLDDRRPRNVPRHMVNLWSRYNVIQNDQHTLGYGLGMVYLDDRLASFGGDLRLPDFTRWDAGLFYTRGMWNTSLYIENLFDKEYYTGSVNDFQIYPGAPITFRGQVGVVF